MNLHSVSRKLVVLAFAAALLAGTVSVANAVVTIDDPDIFDFYLPIFDWGDVDFRTSGSVGCCSVYEDFIPYTDVIE